MKKSGYLGLALLVGLLTAAPVLGQQAKSKAEYDAYMAFYNEQAAETKAELGEAFLNEYKDSEFVPGGYQLLISAYTNAKNHAKVVEVADRFDQNIPSADDKTKSFVYQNAMAAAQQTGNFEEVVRWGDKVLSVEPNNLGAQLTLSSMIPERLPEDPAGKAQALNKAYELASRARAQVEVVFSQPKPAQYTDAQWNGEKAKLQGTIHSTLGLVHLNKEEYLDAAREYETALQLAPRDSVAYFRLGLAYQYQAADVSRRLVEAINAENDAKSNEAEQEVIDELVTTREGLEQETIQKRDKAIESFAKAVVLGGVVQEQARDQLQRLYRAKNNDSLEGLDELINEFRTQFAGAAQN